MLMNRSPKIVTPGTRLTTSAAVRSNVLVICAAEIPLTTNCAALISEITETSVLVNFWATSCVTCVAEMPKLIATHQRYHGQGYETLAVAMSYDPPSYVVNFAQTRQLPFKVAIDNTGAVAREWGDVKLTPTTFLVNKRGEIVKRFVGSPNFEELNQLIEKLLAET